MTGSEEPQKTNAATRLAVDRTRLAYERTLMAWIRTAISLISFGFTIYKFFQIEGAAARQDRVVSATGFSVLMIVFGLLSLLIATLEHRRDVNALRAEYPDMPRSLARVFAALISVLGILASVMVLLRC
jgi:putative membrane protein